MNPDSHSAFAEGFRQGALDTLILLRALILAPYRIARDYVNAEGEFAPRPYKQHK